jgi:hypothetical protein
MIPFLTAEFVARSSAADIDRAAPYAKLNKPPRPRNCPAAGPQKKLAVLSISRSVFVAANVDPSVIIRQHVTVVIVPIVRVADSRDEAAEVPPMNSAVTDPGETVIATDAVSQWAGDQDATARQPVASNATAQWLATDTTAHEPVAAWYSAPGKAGTSADAASAARDSTSEMSTATATMTASTSAVPSHHAGRNRSHTKRNRRHQCNSEPA